MKLFFQIWKNSQVQLIIFYYINVETIGKWKKYIFVSNLKIFTRPANEFLLHECRNNMKMNFFFSYLKILISPANEFLLHKCRNKNIYFFKSEKNYKSSYCFYYINVETVGKWKKYIFVSNLKIFTRPAIEFLLHECRNNMKMIFFFFHIWKYL